MGKAMLLRAGCFGLAMLASAGAAAAEDGWTLTLTGAAVEAEDVDTLGSGGLALERDFGAYWLGGALTFGQGARRLPEADATIDEQSVAGSLWWGVALQDYALTLSFAHSEQSLESGFTSTGGTAIDADGDVRSSSVAATLARSFGARATLTPSFTLSYDETEVETVLQPATGPALAIASEASAVTAIVALDGTAPLGDRADFLWGAAFVATDDAAAQGVATRGGASRASQRQDAGAAQWGEANIGAGLALSDRASVEATLGSTIGRDVDEAFASTALRFSF